MQIAGDEARQYECSRSLEQNSKAGEGHPASQHETGDREPVSLQLRGCLRQPYCVYRLISSMYASAYQTAPSSAQNCGWKSASGRRDTTLAKKIRYSASLWRRGFRSVLLPRKLHRILGGLLAVRPTQTRNNR